MYLEQMHLNRRMYRGGFTEFTREVLSALGYLPLWGNSTFYLRVGSLPVLNPKPPCSPILDSTVNIFMGAGYASLPGASASLYFSSL